MTGDIGHDASHKFARHGTDDQFASGRQTGSCHGIADREDGGGKVRDIRRLRNDLKRTILVDGILDNGCRCGHDKMAGRERNRRFLIEGKERRFAVTRTDPDVIGCLHAHTAGGREQQDRDHSEKLFVEHTFICWLLIACKIKRFLQVVQYLQMRINERKKSWGRSPDYPQ